MINYKHKYYKYLYKYIKLSIDMNGGASNIENIDNIELSSESKSESDQSKYDHSNKSDLQCFEIKKNKDIKVWDLLINDQWKFKGGFPPDVLNVPENELLQSKIWFIKKTIRMKTYYNSKIMPTTNFKIPRDLCIYKSCLKKNDLQNIYDHLEKLFSDYKNLGIIYSYQKNRGLTYLFTGDDNSTQYSTDTMNFLKSYNRDMYIIMENIFRYIASIYNITDIEYLYKYVQLVLLKYNRSDGIWLHIDNVARYDQGPIITMSIGPEITYYDLTPTLLSSNSELKPIRIQLNEGDLVIMDGSSRMEWAHGLPYQVPYKKIKYTIMFKCDKFGEQRKIYNQILDTTISTTKILCD